MIILLSESLIERDFSEIGLCVFSGYDRLHDHGLFKLFSIVFEDFSYSGFVFAGWEALSQLKSPFGKDSFEREKLIHLNKLSDIIRKDGLFWLKVQTSPNPSFYFFWANQIKLGFLLLAHSCYQVMKNSSVSRFALKSGLVFSTKRSILYFKKAFGSME